MLVATVALVGLSGCAEGAAAHPPRAPVPSPARAARAVSLSRTIVTPDAAVSVDELMARARTAFAAQRFDAAAADLDRVTALDPDGPHASEAWFDAGAAHDARGDLGAAAARYQEVARRFPDDPRTRIALVRAVRLLTHLERWQAAGLAADALVARLSTLTPIEQVVAYGGKALALVFAGDLDAAAHYINKGRDIVDAERLDAAGAIPRDLAQLYFALGELRRIRGEQVHLSPPLSDFSRVLERRCQLLLDAQSAYSDTMRAYDAHWSAMAGYRVGELYQHLHDEILRIPLPVAGAGSPDAPALFEGAMRLRYSVLLQKGLAMMEHTVALATRTGEQSEWVSRAVIAKGQLENALRLEEAALARLPYRREDLERALEDLARRARDGRKR